MEEAKEKILLEFGALDIVPAHRKEDAAFEYSPMAKMRAGLRRVRSLKGHAGERIRVEGLPYESFGEDLTGGRIPEVGSVDELLRCISLCNGLGVSFNLALNGGKFLSEAGIENMCRDPETGVGRVLKELDVSASSHFVKNHVTIYRDELLDVVEGLYPELGTVASCVKFTTNGVDRVLRLYERAFERYDHVVALPQHSNIELLGNFPDNAGQMMLFPNLGCSEKDTRICKGHYAGLDVPGKYVSPRCSRGCSNRMDYLIDRKEKDLIPLIQMGVRAFKFPRYVAEMGFSMAAELVDLVAEEVGGA